MPSSKNWIIHTRAKIIERKFAAIRKSVGLKLFALVGCIGHGIGIVPHQTKRIVVVQRATLPCYFEVVVIHAMSRLVGDEGR